MEHDIFLRLDTVEAKLDAILTAVATLSSANSAAFTSLGAHIMQELDDLQAKVTEINTVEESAIALLNGLSAQLTAAAGNPAQVQAIADSLSAESAKLAAAVAANTPAA